jgi:hypothetical protein
MYSACNTLLSELKDLHCELYDDWNMHAHPHVIYAACYQDGMMHCLQRIDQMRGAGEYSDRHVVLAKIGGYEQHKAEKMAAGAFEDVAYIDGYINALTYVSLDDPEVTPPLWYLPKLKAGVFTKSAFRRAMKHFGNRRAIARAKSLVRKCPPGTVFHHRCQLL